ncbi:MAG: hypothetical protein Greene041662_629 [Candidatus Peregrinibacteria bacterium Greene0416_62]|nr:MAG: hypothetical protein Greene041662_629 [Candidatus Peregrinibacteria bacterium Greene0416_62]
MVAFEGTSAALQSSEAAMGAESCITLGAAAKVGLLVGGFALAAYLIFRK